jgi:hypothetical protein
VRVQIAWQGFTTVDRAIIERVEVEDRARNQEHLAEWRQEHISLQERQKAEEQFEAAQREKGLVKRGTEWVSAEELARQDAEQAEAREQERVRQQMADLTERLQALERENLALRAELQRTPQIVRQFVHVPTDFLVHRRHRVDRGRDGSLFRDPHGNVVRVREHGGHKSFTASDGRHVDLTLQDGRLGFTDTAGTRHDLTPVRRK